MSNLIGDAFIRVAADTSGFRRELDSEVEAAAESVEADVEVTADTDGLRGEVSRAAAVAGAGQSIEIETRIDSDPVRRATSAFDGFISSAGRANTTVRFFQNSLRLIKWPLLISGATLALQAIGALSGGVVGLIGSLSRLSGLAATIPGLLSSIFQGASAVGLAFVGVGDAIEALNEGDIEKIAEAMEDLPPPAQEFARLIAGLKPQFDELRQVAARNLFPGLTSGIRSALPLFPIFRDAMGETARAIGNLAAEGGRLVSSPAFAGDLQALADQNVRSITQFGTVGLNLADVLRNIAAAAIPLVDRLGELAIGWSETAREAAEAGRQSGRLQAFFERTAKTFETVIDIGGNLIGTFINIGSAGTDLGDDLLESFEKITEGWEEFTGSVEGQNRLKQFFDEIRPTITQVGGLITDLGRALIRIVEHPSSAEFVRTLRESALPAIERILTAFSELGPEIGTSFGRFIELVEQLVTIPGFGTFIESVGLLAKTAAELLEHVPGLRQLVGVFLAIQGVAAAGALLQFAGGFLQAATATRVLLGAFGSLRAILPLVAAAIGLPLGPILLIGAAIAGLAYLVVTNWDTVKQWTQNTWNFVKTHIDTIIRVVVGIVTGGVSEIVRFIINNWGTIRSKTTEIFNSIRDFLSSTWNNVRSAAANIWNNILSTLRGIFNNILGAVRTAFENARASAVNAFNALRDGVVNVINHLLGIVRNLPGSIVSALGNLGNLLWGAGQDIVQGMINGVRSMGRSLLNAILNIIPGPIRRIVASTLGIGSPSKVFREFGVNVMEGLILGLQDQRRELARRMEEVADTVSGTQLRLGEIESATMGRIDTSRQRAEEARQTARAGRGITVAKLELHLQGVFDPTDPMVGRKIMQNVRDGLRQLEEEHA